MLHVLCHIIAQIDSFGATTLTSIETHDMHAATHVASKARLAGLYSIVIIERHAC